MERFWKGWRTKRGWSRQRTEQGNEFIERFIYLLWIGELGPMKLDPRLAEECGPGQDGTMEKRETGYGNQEFKGNQGKKMEVYCGAELR